MKQYADVKETKDEREDAQVQSEYEEGMELPQKWYHVNKNLIMLKITLFFLYGATSSLIPYLTIHMQSIGLSMENIAYIYLTLPLTTFLAPPLTGFLVDKFGKYKPVIVVAFLTAAVIHHSLLLIPTKEVKGEVPAGYVITHPRKMYIEVWWSPCPSRECPEEEELDIVLEYCVDHCLLKAARKIKQQGLNFSDPGDPGDLDDLIFHVSKNKSNVLDITLDMHEKLGEPTEELGIEMESAEDDSSVTDIGKRFNPKLLKRYGVNVTELENNDLRCGGKVAGANDTTKTRLKDLSFDCILQKCSFGEGGPKRCPPDFKETDSSTFWIYFILRFLGSVMVSAGVTIMDPLALSLIEKFGGDFGKERLFSSLGMAIFSPVTGFLIDLSSKKAGYTDYSAAFYTFDVLMVISAVAVYLMPSVTKLPSDNVFKDLMKIFKMGKVLIFIGFLFVLGNLWGFIESYLFFYLKDLGAPTSLLGITVTVGTISSLPFLYGAEEITNKIGHVNIFIIAFIAHAARLMGYSIIENAWWCLINEALESLSVHLMWVAAATYCTVLAPSNLLATLIGVCGMAHYSIGRGCGSFFGGILIGKYGIRSSFKLMGGVALVSAIAYAILYQCWLRDDDEESDEETAAPLNNGMPKYKDQATMVSQEKLGSIMIEYNPIGSLVSLTPYHRARSNNAIRRGSYSGAGTKVNSKNDLLKSNVEVSQSKSQAKLNKIEGSGRIYTSLSNELKEMKEDKESPNLGKQGKRSQSLAYQDNRNIPNEKDEIKYQNDIKEKSESESNYDSTNNGKQIS